MKSSEPSLNQAYALVIEDECQKGSSMNTVSQWIVGGNDIPSLWSTRGPLQNYKKSHNEHWNEKCDL